MKEILKPQKQPKITKATEMAANYTKMKAEQKEEKKEFKMKRF